MPDTILVRGGGRGGDRSFIIDRFIYSLADEEELERVGQLKRAYCTAPECAKLFTSDQAGE